MRAVTVRKISEKTHRALKLRAARNGRSTEAEIRKILDDAASANSDVGLGSQLAALGRRFGGIDRAVGETSPDAMPSRGGVGSIWRRVFTVSVRRRK